MTHTEMVLFINKEFTRNGKTWDSEEEFWQMILPEEPFKRSTLNHWLNKKSHSIRKGIYLHGMAESIGFDVALWDADTLTQQETIRVAVKALLKAEEYIDLSDLVPQNTPLSTEQKEILTSIKPLEDDNVAALIEEHLHLLEPTLKNQSFLLKLLSELYARGSYDFLEASVFPAILPHNRDDMKVKLMRAHTLGSLTVPKYVEAAMLLNTLADDAHADIVDLKTSAISNMRRELLTNKGMDKQEIHDALDVLKQYYTVAYRKESEFHYYPGINLLYVLVLLHTLFPDGPSVDAKSLQQIYTDAKPSIQEEKATTSAETRYYASISELEFMLLLGQQGVSEKLYLLIEILEPSHSLVKRTLRQMRFFVETLERFPSEPHTLIIDFEEAIDIFDGFLTDTKK